MTSSFDFNEFMQIVHEEQVAHPSWRYGQTLYNVLYEHWPDIAAEVMNTAVDPFYEDGKDRVHKFFNHLFTM